MAAEADTHGAVLTAAGGTTADTDTNLGTITFPAGGPWKIFQVWCMVAAATATAAECVGGTFRFEARSGDLEPNPAPSRFPTGLIGSFLGATADQVQIPLTLHNVNWQMAGKGLLDIIYRNPTTNTVAPQVAAGVIYGTTRPELKPFIYMDRVEANITSAADTSIGTITLSENAKLITAICGLFAINGVLTTAEEHIGFFRLASDDVKLPPAQFPFSSANSAGLGALIGQNTHVRPVYIPVNIPLEKGARIDCFSDFNTAITTGLQTEIYIAYE